MDKPGFGAVLIGNRVSHTLILAGTVFLGAVFWAQPPDAPGAVPWFVPIVGLGLSSAARKARKELVTYRRWRADWDAMAGLPPPGPSLTARGLRFLLLPGLWLLFTGAIDSVAGEPMDDNIQALCLGWVGLSLLLVGRALFALVRRLRRSKAERASQAPRREKEHLVTVVPSVPRRSPGPAEFNDVPAYARPLLAARNV